MRRTTLPAALLLTLLVASPAAAGGGPRRLSEAERQAVLLAAGYLERGPAAWVDRLAAGSPLAALGREAALQEIEVRAGSPEEARWTLEAAPADFARRGAVLTLDFPSGADDTLFLELAEEGGSWKIAALRVAAEPGPVRSAASASMDSIGASTPAEAGAGGGSGRIFRAAVAAALAAVAAALLAGAAVAHRRRPKRLASTSVYAGAAVARRPAPLVVGLAAAGALAVVAALGFLAAAFLAGGEAGRSAAPGPVEEEAAPAFVELRSLLPLRRSLTQAGGSGTEAEAPRGEGTVGRVAQLWQAQHLLGEMDLNGVAAILGQFSLPGKAPLVDLLRARLQFLRLEQNAAALSFERSMDVGLKHEGLLTESAEAFLILGFEDHAQKYLEQLRELGARRSAPYSYLAMLAVTKDRMGEAGEAFRAGWLAQPEERADLLGHPLLAAVFVDPSLRRLVELDSPLEPKVPCAATALRPVALPGFEVRLLGEMLRLRRGAAELVVPGGCDLAPTTASTDDAGAWARAEEVSRLARLPELLRSAHTAGALAQPSLRRKVEETAEALAGRNRWADLVALTDGLSQRAANLPPNLALLRAVALQRLERKTEARDLLIVLAKGNTKEGRTDPSTLYMLADLLAEEGQYDTAMKLVLKANAQLPYPPGEERVRQIKLEKQLASSYEIHRTANFELRYPAGRGKEFAQKAGEVLEAERRRLAKWIPTTSGRPPVEVHFLPFDDFRAVYSPGFDVVGLFDGKIHLPFGEVRRFEPIVVAILSHELAHAMIAQRTDDRAPKWFHEGLAQHVMMVQERVNPVAGYRAKGNLLSFPLIEGALAGFASPEFVAIAYEEANWVMHYIEARYGTAGIQRLQDAFRAGKTTEEALASALGTNGPAFDRALWDWCLTKAPDAWDVPLVRYDTEVEM